MVLSVFATPDAFYSNTSWSPLQSCRALSQKGMSFISKQIRHNWENHNHIIRPVQSMAFYFSLIVFLCFFSIIIITVFSRLEAPWNFFSSVRPSCQTLCDGDYDCKAIPLGFIISMHWPTFACKCLPYTVYLKNQVIWVVDMNSNKELFIAHTHEKTEKSYKLILFSTAIQLYYCIFLCSKGWADSTERPGVL